MAVESKMTRNSAKQWIGQPVYIELKDGRSYVGWVTDAKSGQLILSGQRSPRKTKMISTKRAGKATVSSFIPGMLGLIGGGSMFGGGMIPGVGGVGGGSTEGGIGGGFGDFGGLENIMGIMGKAFPMIKMGYGMIKSMMPIMKMFNV
ncbi:hypothetical protein [Paenibacillus montanisoli]|uniref:Uncharacterized protein n=1 Tax=Paenibacillus montanisoli TaxID=2081970 RepID=A0A328TZX9_9BACL|nr:hypothetical protein [Paenibacillus montanisoli]RAP76117.1 hypothetical protein DL346_11915 [Paenibacillus montanisoli]